MQSAVAKGGGKRSMPSRLHTRLHQRQRMISFNFGDVVTTPAPTLIFEFISNGDERSPRTGDIERHAERGYDCGLLRTSFGKGLLNQKNLRLTGGGEET